MGGGAEDRKHDRCNVVALTQSYIMQVATLVLYMMMRVSILLYTNTKLRFFAAFRRFLSIWLLRGEYIGSLVLGVGLYASTRLIMMLDVS